MATIKELAAKCGVSIGTVDRVLHNRGRVSAKTRELVLSTAEEMQYIPNRAAQSLAARKKSFISDLSPYPQNNILSLLMLTMQPFKKPRN